jgi:hypothetical protein
MSSIFYIPGPLNGGIGGGPGKDIVGIYPDQLLKGYGGSIITSGWLNGIGGGFTPGSSIKGSGGIISSVILWSWKCY